MLQNRHLDKSVPTPLHYQLKTVIAEEIAGGNYPVGSLIPTEAELSEIFQVSRTTVRQAVAELVYEGKLYRVKSKGTFVARPKINQEFMNRLQSFNEEIAKSGRVPSTEVLALEEVKMPEEMRQLYAGKAPERAILLYRRRLADDDPIVCVRTYLPCEKCRFILDHDFTRESLYHVLSADEKTRVCRVSRICEAVPAEKEDTRLLKIAQGSPIHFFTTFGYNLNNEIIEYSLARYRGDQNKFHVTITL